MEDDRFCCELDESKLKKIVKKSYLEQGRKVKVEIVYIRDGKNFILPRIDIYENVYISGIKLKKSFSLTYEEVWNIVKNAFEKKGFKFINVVPNAKIERSLIAEVFNLPGGVNVIDKTFSVYAREKEVVLQKKKNNR